MDLFNQVTEKPNPKQAVVDQFNRDFPPGTMVMLRKDSGRILTRGRRGWET